MSLYSDLFPDTSTSSTSSTSTLTTSTTITTPTSTTVASTTPKPAFIGAPRSLLASSGGSSGIGIGSTLTPAQRAIQIAAAAQRSAANRAAAAAAATATTASTNTTIITNGAHPNMTTPNIPPATTTTMTAIHTPLTSNIHINVPHAVTSTMSSHTPTVASVDAHMIPNHDTNKMNDVDDDDDDDDDAIALQPIPNEYDPRIPNDYMEYIAQREARRKEEEREAMERREEREREREQRDRHHEDDDDGRHREHRTSDSSHHRGGADDITLRMNQYIASHQPTTISTPPSISSTQSAPSPNFTSSVALSSSSTSSSLSGAPKLDLSVSSGEEAFARRQAMSRQVGGGGGGGGVNVPSISLKSQAFVPSSSGGIIGGVNDIGVTTSSVSPHTPPSVIDDNTSMNHTSKRARNHDSIHAIVGGTPSRVLLLLNMVGRGDVDEELESETAEECAKYGRVLKCTVFEYAHAPEHEAVRIFVKFETMDSAQRAASTLNGRFFGGRQVVAQFVEEMKFNKGQLAP